MKVANLKPWPTLHMVCKKSKPAHNLLVAVHLTFLVVEKNALTTGHAVTEKTTATRILRSRLVPSLMLTWHGICIALTVPLQRLSRMSVGIISSMLLMYSVSVAFENFIKTSLFL
jgi:hypothetical protein